MFWAAECYAEASLLPSLRRLAESVTPEDDPGWASCLQSALVACGGGVLNISENG